MMNNSLFPNPLEILSRLKSAVKTGAKTFTGATKRAGRGAKDIAGAFKPETYVAEQDRSVPGPKRPLVNRLQQAGLGVTDITGALGQGALTLPSAGFGFFQPEAEALMKVGAKAIPEPVKKVSKNFFKKVSEVVPEDIKRQMGSTAFSAIGLGMLAGTPWGQMKFKPPVKGMVKPMKSTMTKKEVVAKLKKMGVPDDDIKHAMDTYKYPQDAIGDFTRGGYVAPGRRRLTFESQRSPRKPRLTYEANEQTGMPLVRRLATEPTKKRGLTTSQKEGTYPLDTTYSTSVIKEKYTWGDLIKVRFGDRGISGSAILHPEHQTLLRGMKNGMTKTFIDEQGIKWLVEKLPKSQFNFKALTRGVGLRGTADLSGKLRVAKPKITEWISMNEFLRNNPEAAKALFKNTTLDKSGRIVPKKPTK